MKERHAVGVKVRLGPVPRCWVSRTATVAGGLAPTSTQSPWEHRELFRQLAGELALNSPASGFFTERIVHTSSWDEAGN
jgi:hypothetical protein